MNIGTAKSEFPRNYGVPMRGWDPQNPSTLTISLPLDASLDGDIWEGQIISMNDDGTAWVLGCNAENPGVVAFAQNSTKSTDVISANNLVGLSCSGKFRVATPFFTRTVCTTTPEGGANVASYTPGTRVTFCKDNEYDIVSDVVPVQVDGVPVMRVKNTARSAKGFIRPAKATEPVIGVVVGSIPDIPASAIGALNHNAKGLTHKSSGSVSPADASANTKDYAMPNTGVVALAHTWEDTIDSTAQINNSYYVVIDTTFAPQA